MPGKINYFRCILMVCLLTLGVSIHLETMDTALAAHGPRGEYIRVNGRQIYLEQYGHGRALVLLHGGLATIQTSFEKQLPVFAKNHHVIAIEQVGHGHTPDSNFPFSYEQMADDTEKVLRFLKVRDADIVGWSDGGILALLIAIKHPELVHRLVISGANTTLVGMNPTEVKKIKDLSAEELAQDTAPPVQEAYGKVSPDGPGHWPVVVKKVWDLWLTPVVIPREELVKVKAPVLVICGDNDIIPLTHTLEIFKSLPKAELLVLPGTDHDTFNEAAETLNPIVLTFLDASLSLPHGSHQGG
jgi:pimeloyl-ACP methyl ester carboxylesterase